MSHGVQLSGNEMLNRKVKNSANRTKSVKRQHNWTHAATTGAINNNLRSLYLAVCDQRREV